MLLYFRTLPDISLTFLEVSHFVLLTFQVVENK